MERFLWDRFLWVCFAGALGTGARYLVGLWAPRAFGSGFPYATLIVNVAGCFLIAAVIQLALNAASFPPDLRVALTVGFAGGLTTYSSFNHETTRLLQEGAPGLALLNFGVMVFGCFVAGLLGFALIGRWATG
jgi:CrcB protein